MSLEWTPHVQQVSCPKYRENKLDKLLGAVKTFLRQTFYRNFFFVLVTAHDVLCLVILPEA